MRNLSGLVVAAVLAAAPAFAAQAQAAKPAAAPAGPVRTGSATVNDDVRCLMSMVVLSQQKDRQAAGQIGAAYFMGRINIRSPGLDLSAAMKAQAPSLLNAAEVSAELQRCGPLVQSSSLSIQNALNALKPPAPPAGTAAPPAAGAAPAPPAAATPPKK